MNIATLFTKTNTALNDIVQRLSAEQLKIVMPDYSAFKKGQPLRTTLNMCAYENACVPRMLAGEKGLQPNPEISEDYLKDEFKINFDQLTTKANAAVALCSEKDLDRTVHMSYADTAARGYLSDIIIQRSMAAIDIAQAVGISFSWPEDLVQGIIALAQAHAPLLREYGVFLPEVQLPADAPLQAKLIAIMGRQP